MRFEKLVEGRLGAVGVRRFEKRVPSFLPKAREPPTANPEKELPHHAAALSLEISENLSEIGDQQNIGGRFRVGSSF